MSFNTFEETVETVETVEHKAYVTPKESNPSVEYLGFNSPKETVKLLIIQLRLKEIRLQRKFLFWLF